MAKSWKKLNPPPFFADEIFDG
ncbi:MAG: hypothetical protein H6Q43_3892, partial [Deltaproteobacteria bacterium]|nr:hypothetical protein [Deltaproteobacteria bacterium]